MIKSLLYNIANMSPCNKRKVGAFIKCENCNKILSIGYNKGMLKDCEIDGITLKDVIHAEVHALLKITKCKCNKSILNIYITEKPCVNCIHALYISNIKTIYYIKDNLRPKPYRDKILSEFKDIRLIKI